MKILVTGGAGFIGYHTSREVLRKGHELVIIDDFSNGTVKNIEDLLDEFGPQIYGIKVHNQTINHPQKMLELVRDVDAVIHLAAKVSVPLSVTDPYYTSQTNVGGFIGVLNAVRENKIKRFVYASSAAIYGDSPPPHREEAVSLFPRSPYGLDKLTNEMYSELFRDLYDIETLGLRYFNVYGPRQDPSSPYSGVIAKFIGQIKKNEPITIRGDGHQIRTFVYVEDVAKFNVLACEIAEPCRFGGICNVGNPESTVSINELADRVNRLISSPVEILYTETAPGDVRCSQPDLSNLKRLFKGHQMTPLAQGLTDLLYSQ